MASHSIILSWRIPGMGEPSGLPSMGSHRVRHDRSDFAAAAAAIFHCIYVPHLYPFFCDGHLDCFYVLAVVNSAAKNIEVCVYFLFFLVFFFHLFLLVGG